MRSQLHTVLLFCAFSNLLACSQAGTSSVGKNSRVKSRNNKTQKNRVRVIVQPTNEESTTEHPVTYANECRVSLKYDLLKNQPLLIRHGGTKDLYGFFMPDAAGVLHVPKGEKIVVACPGKGNKITKLETDEDIVVTCDGCNMFSTSDKQKRTFEDFNCKSSITHSTRNNMQEQCEILGDYSVKDIGFELADGSFYTIIKACFNERTSDAVYTKYIQTAAISGAQHGKQRPSFIEGPFYPDIEVNSKYVKDGQKATVAKILGSDELADKYIGKGNHYLARGHLTARADFVYSPHQRATFWYMNAAPQWQTFNGGNWKTLESNVRSFTASNGKDLTIYTGTHGVTTLPDVKNVQKPIYLHIDDKNVGKLKVPELFWKVLYEPTSKKGVAFVGKNNPYLSGVFPLCNDICDKIRWLTWEPNIQKKGYGYCCEVDDLRKAIPTIPKLTVTGLLAK